MELKINVKYKPLFNLKTRYTLVTGGRGSGKSFGIATALSLDCFRPGRGWLMTRSTMSSAKISVIPEFMDKIEQLSLQNEFKIDKSDDKVIHIKSGSFILFKGLKSSDGKMNSQLKSLKGINGWFCDEAIEISDETEFNKIDLSIRDKNRFNAIILGLNPEKRGHWIEERWFAKADDGTRVFDGFNGIIGDTTYISTTFLDNIDHLERSFLQAAANMRVKNPKRYDNIFLGYWTDDGGMGFNVSDFRKYNADCIHREDFNIYIFVDPSGGKGKKSDYSTFIVAGLGKDKNYYILDGIRGRFVLTERTSRLFELVRKWQPVNTYYEQYAMQADIEHIKEDMNHLNYRFEITPVGGQVSKMNRISALEPLFRKHRILFPEILGYYDEDRMYRDFTQDFYSEEFVKFPYNVDRAGLHDDMLDCLARLSDPAVKLEFPEESGEFLSGRFVKHSSESYDPLMF